GALGATPSILGAPYRLTDLDAYLVQLGATAKKLGSKALILSQMVASMAGDAAAAQQGDTQLLIAEELLGGGPAVPLDPDGAPGACTVQLCSVSTGHSRGGIIPHEWAMLCMESMSWALPSAVRAVAGSWLPLHYD